MATDAFEPHERAVLQLLADTQKLMAETSKLTSEARKADRERWWFPVLAILLAILGNVGISAAVGAVMVALLTHWK